MRFPKKMAAALAVTSLAAAPVMAQSSTRASAPTTDASELNGNAATWFGLIAAVAVVILAVVAASKDHNDPVSA